MNQALIDEIVSGVLARLQPAPVRPVDQDSRPQFVAIASRKADSPTAPVATSVTVPAPLFAASSSVAARATVVRGQATANVATTPVANTQFATTPVPTVVELSGPIITADLLEQSLRSGQSLRIGRTAILTPSARDWLNAKRTPWTRQDKAGSVSSGPRAKWQIILQTVTPTVRSLQEGLRRLADGWKIELVGQPLEAAKLATSLVNTAECDGVVIFTEQAELVACQANRHERVRAAVMQNCKQWEHAMRTLGANVVCISPIGRTFIELRNLLRDCAGTRPQAPTGM